MRSASAAGTWETVSARPDPRLRGHVAGYVGYAEDLAAPLRRLEVPTLWVPLILSLGPSLLVDGVRHRSFFAGPDDAPSVTEHAGRQLGVEVKLTPLGARRLLGLPMEEVARQVVPVADLLGARGERLVAALGEASSWPARFALLDRALVRRLDTAPPIAPEVLGAWRRLHETRGAVGVAALAEASGWSRRHLTARFRAEVGLPPKTVARILRFERACDALRARVRADTGRPGLDLAQVAYGCGYADQSHLNRDFRAFAGTTPTDFVARLLRAGGVSGDLPNVQDGVARAA